MKTLSKSLLIATALVAAPITAASCQQIPTAQANWSAAASPTIPFELFRGNRIAANGTINGHAVEFLLDTGAGVTTVDRAFARQIGLPAGQKVEAQGAGGTVEAEIVTGVTLTIGSLTLVNAPVAVMDLAPVARGLGRPMTVVLGRELFDHSVVTIDWRAKSLTLAAPDRFAPPAGATTIALGRGGDRLNTVEVALAGLAPISGHLDIGNGGVLSLPQKYWETKPELTRLRHAESQSGGVGGLHGARLVTVDDVEFGGQRFTHVPVVLDQARGRHAVDEVNIGIGLLKPFRVTMDLGRDKLYLQPLPGPAEFIRDRSGLRTEFDGKALSLVFVSPGSPAAEAGLKAGDRLVAVDGQRVAADFYSSAASGWNQRPAGERVELGLADGRSVTVKLADYY